MDRIKYQIGSIIYGWKRILNELRNRKKRWKCKIKISMHRQTLHPYRLSPWNYQTSYGHVIACSMSRTEQHPQKYYQSILNTVHKLSHCIELHSIGLKYLFGIFNITIDTIFLLLLLYSLTSVSFMYPCYFYLEFGIGSATTSCIVSSCLCDIFNISICSCIDIQSRSRYHSHLLYVKLWPTIPLLVICLLTLLVRSKNAKITLYHYNKMMFDNKYMKTNARAQHYRRERNLHTITMKAIINVQDWCHRVRYASNGFLMCVNMHICVSTLRSYKSITTNVNTERPKLTHTHTTQTEAK